MELIRDELLPGVFLSTVQTDKFKSECLSVNLLTQLRRDTVSKNALIPRVLARGTVRHPDMEAIAACCDELYGAGLIPCVRKFGEVLALGFYAGFIADRFAPGGEKLLESVAGLLGEVLLSPATRGGLLNREYVESEKEKLMDDIRARINDKRSYAAFRLVEEMCAYEDYGCDEMGSLADAEAVGYVELTRHYRDLLRTCPIEIFYCGASPRRRVADALREALMTLPRGEIDYDIGTDVRINAVTAEPREFDEALDVTQGKLCLGFRLGECMEDPDFAAIRVFNRIYGGYTGSRLFTNVREKLSLCYYASSNCAVSKGVMLVDAGIEFDKLDEAKSEILAQLEAVKRGEFSDEELENAKRALVSDMRSLTDSAGSLESFCLSYTLLGLDFGPEQFAGLCAGVSREDVIAVARGVELDSVYFLHGPDDDDDSDSSDEEVTEDGEA